MDVCKKIFLCTRIRTSDISAINNKYKAYRTVENSCIFNEICLTFWLDKTNLHRRLGKLSKNGEKRGYNEVNCTTDT